MPMPQATVTSKFKSRLHISGRELEDKQHEDEKLYRAHVAGAYDDQEFAARRKLLKTEVTTMTSEE